MPKWTVVGGADKGGILVRSGQDLKSPQCDERLSTGAVVEEVSKAGDRLEYQLISGTGPPTGWVSTKLTGKDLLVPSDDSADGATATPAKATSWSEVRAKAKAGPAIATTLKANGSPWLSSVGKAKEAAKVRVVLFNWTGNRGGAGSNHQFTSWTKALQEQCPDCFEVCQVNYPGRGARMKEANAEDASIIVSGVASTLQKCGALPTVLFGFSFGAILAYETACALSAMASPALLGLVVASAEHPGWPGRKSGVDVDNKPTKGASEARFEQVLKDKGGTDVILSSPDMKKMYLPVIRSDMVMEEAYGEKPPANPALPCPVIAFRGKKCPIIARADVDPWLEVTSCKEGTPTRVEEIETQLTPEKTAPWLSDWYLCQGQASAAAMISVIAKEFGDK